MKIKANALERRGNREASRKGGFLNPSGRRQERATITRRRILEATLDCIAEHGYEGATMDLIVARAGVSRGAQMHHFPRKLALAAEAMDYMLDSFISDLRSRTESIRLNKGSPWQLFEYLWEHYFSARLFKVTMELVATAMSDDELRNRLIPIVDKFHRNLDDCWYLICRNGEYEDRKILTAFNLTMSLLRGFAFQMMLWNRPEIFKKSLQEWLTIMSTYLTSHN